MILIINYKITISTETDKRYDSSRASIPLGYKPYSKLTM